MPYFLSSEFAAIIENKNALDEKMRAEAEKNKPPATSSSTAYKSQFLKEKLVSQNDKRKQDRKKPKEKPAEEGKENAPGLKGAKGGKMVKKKGQSDEDLVDIIDELREDLKTRDQEYEQLRARMEKLEALNTHLAEKLHQSKLSHVADTATLNNMRNVKEI